MNRVGAFSQDDGIPLYVKLASLFRDLIGQGEWTIGAQIPPLPALQESYGVARATVRQAIGILQEEGYLSSQRGRGTYVLRSPPARSANPQAPGHDQLNLDARFSIRIVGHAECSRGYGPARFIPEAEGPLVSARKLHLFEDKPYSIVDFIMPRRYFEMIPEGLDTTRLYAQLVRDHTGLVHLVGDQVMTVNLAGHEVARLLEVPLATPIVQLDSTLTEVGATAPVMAHRSLIRSDLFLLRRRIANVFERSADDWRPTVRPENEG
ncbi:GntR family transcriptional regulator [Mesorhizobium sp. CAU 1741]|uniref:GntR family transcriptional regulator n=1 Tax=Mesorhizobium sp. CAU 1741 TaxID=3140366 RepID=UPI00325A7DDF